jgi:hypothetical protein
MNGNEVTQLKEIHASVIRLEEMMKGVKEHIEIHRVSCEKRDSRITKLEICGGRIKGIFATISAAAVILTMVITFLITKFLWK